MCRRYILGIDPSGNFDEGKGTTGWCLLDSKTGKVCKFGYISADKYPTQYAYWNAHIALLESLMGYHYEVIIEDYQLYANRATDQINSKLETPRLIGIIEYECWMRSIPLYKELAAAVKTRWSENILEHKGYLKRKGLSNRWCISQKDGKVLTEVPDHVRDALKHAVHRYTFRKDDYNGRTNIRKTKSTTTNLYGEHPISRRRSVRYR